MPHISGFLDLLQCYDGSKNNLANVFLWSSNKMKLVVSSTTVGEVLSVVNRLQEAVFSRAIM